MVNYKKSVVYKLCCKDLNVKEIYVGSTTNFTRRKARHKENCTREKSGNFHIKVYKFIRENGGWDNWDMVEVKKVKCRDKKHLHKKERKYYEKLGATLNTIVPGRSQKEYIEANKDIIKHRHKKYRDNNKEKIAIRNKKYREKNIDVIKEKDKVKSKKYYQKNKKIIAEKLKAYYQKRKEYRAEKINCPCGSSVRRDAIRRHEKSKKHIEYITVL